MRLSLWTATFIVFLTLTVSIGPGNATDGSGRFESLKRFSQVLDLVERYYVSDVSRDELMEGAIRGMLQNLDPHSAFLDASEYREMQESTSGEFYGIGIEITQQNDRLMVVAPIADTPADRAGLRAGDLILAVDGKPTQDMRLDESVSRIRGPKGSTVDLTILHEGENTPKTVTIERDAIPIISVKAHELEPGYLWVRLSRFSERTTSELHDAIREERKRGPIKGLILDLRNNPGGLLDQAVHVADTFLSKGTIVSIKGRIENNNRDFKATAQANDVESPLVVLVNAGSASASEIVAGALRDHKRGLLLGERTFGKGSVQNVIPLADGSGVKLTIALYHTPDGTSIQAEGVEPDIQLPFVQPAKDEEGKPSHPFGVMREKDLARHLENGKDKTPDKSKRDQDAIESLARDNQLRMGLQLVKQLPRLQAIH
ncbi:S41 family peptidase [Oleidesulfovibrio sp.]|uniref:S41 family peptidase n=1 Tax=Oleidesulfovibrio sp. TaxID=2909707 RepID=UPI003A8724B3